MAEQRETFQIASAEQAVLKAKEEQVTAHAGVRLNRFDLLILKMKQKEAKTGARKGAEPNMQPYSVAIGLWPSLIPVRESKDRP